MSDSERTHDDAEAIEGEEDSDYQSHDETAHDGAGGDRERTTVVVDDREPTEVKILALDHPHVDDYLEERIEAADIVVNGIAIERKTPSDFASSITEDRLEDQVDKLADAYDHAYLLLEGGFERFERLGHSDIKPESLRGRAASLTARSGIPVVPTGWDKDRTQRRARLVDYAMRLGQKHTTEPVSSHLPTGPVGSSEPSAKRMWGCVDRIGPELAERLYEQIGTPLDLTEGMDLSEALTRLEGIDGIGEATAQTVVEDLLGGSDV